MGLFSNFNPLKMLQKPLEFISKAAETVSKFAGGIADFGGKLLSFLNKPASEIIEPIAKKVSEKVKNVPFVGKFLAPVVENLMKQGATALVGEGPVGALGFMTKATSKIQDLTKIAETVRGAADKVDAFADNVLGQKNVQNLIAARHGALIE